MFLQDKVEAVKVERNILAKVSHPNIVSFFYSFHDSSSLYFAMELVRGGELLHAIRYYADERTKASGGIQQALTVDEARYYAAQIVVALEYLHISQKVVHRDLKPENILLTVEGKIKLVKFVYHCHVSWVIHSHH